MTKKKTALVVKTQRLSESIQRLSLGEIRVLQLAIIGARETGQGLSPEKPLVLRATDYAEAFDVTRQTAYELMVNAEQKLFGRYFTIIDPKYNLPRKSHWIQDVLYLKDQGSIQLTFTRTVVDQITRIDGAQDFFTKYTLENTVNLTSSYAMRLYELLCKWTQFQGSTTSLYPLETLRGQLGLVEGEYQRTTNFRARVLDVAVDQINQHTDLKVSYEQEKKGRRVSGFRFKVKPKTAPINSEKPDNSPGVPKRADPVYNNIALSKITEYASQISQLPDQMAAWSSYGGQGKMQTVITAELITPEGYQKWLPELKQLGHQELI